MPAAVRTWRDLLQRLPNEIRLDGWLGPTLFTPEACHGELATLAAFCGASGDHEHLQSIVIGSVRETQGNTQRAYAAFCVEPRTARIVLVDLDPPYRVRFVNSGIEEFVASLDAFVAGWPLLKASEEAAASYAVEELRSKLAAIDAASLVEGDAFWPTALDTYC